MGWGTSFKTELYISREVFNTEGQLDDKIEETEELIKSYEQQIMMFASATPKDIVPQDSEKWEPIEYINMTIPPLFRELENEYYKLFLLKELKENWEGYTNG